jgi:hypothetical protein
MRVLFLRRLGAVVATLPIAALIAACGSSSGPSSAPPTTASSPPPAGLPSFYGVPKPLPAGPPGRLLKSEEVPAQGIDGTVYRVMYLSESARNAIVPVTGLVIVPHEPPPPGGYPVVSWGHGTDGMADQCAPSLDPESAVPEANSLLGQGWEVTASDYEGEGTPGLLPYLVGVVAARGTIDVVRAAGQLAPAHASKRYVVWGHSEGGQTALFALKIASSYAPDLDLEGVVAGAAPSQFNLVYDFLKTSPYRYYLFMAAGGFNAGYGNEAAPLSEVLTPLGLSLLPTLEKGCSAYLQKTLDKYSLTEVTKADPFTVPAWQKLLAENDPESFTTPGSAPLLMPQGGNDDQIPVVSTQILASHLCSIGQDLERWIYPGKSHSGVIPYYVPDMVHWIANRFAGMPNPDPYMPTGVRGVQVTRCPTS